MARPYNAALMSADLPESIDAWRAIASRRVFEGRVPLAAFPRLVDSLADSQGECRFRLSFDRDALGIAAVEVEADTQLPLICQRSLQRFLFPVHVQQKLGLLKSEQEEAGLPSDVEPVLVDAEGELRLLELVEDELILALPVVPLGPEGLADAEVLKATEVPAEEPRKNPFAALAALKKQSS